MDVFNNDFFSNMMKEKTYDMIQHWMNVSAGTLFRVKKVVDEDGVIHRPRLYLNKTTSDRSERADMIPVEYGDILMFMNFYYLDDEEGFDKGEKYKIFRFEFLYNEQVLCCDRIGMALDSVTEFLEECHSFSTSDTSEPKSEK